MPITDQAEFDLEFQKHERDDRIVSGQIASLLVILLMPLGTTLDYFVYPEPRLLKRFFVARLICSALASVVWFLHRTQFGARYYRLIGLPIALLPAAFISWMIYQKEGPTSPYYAGLNLVLLAVSVVVHWSLTESFLAVLSVIAMYLVACIGQEGAISNFGIFFNNIYFLTLTGIIVITGNYFFNRLRLREFTLNYELALNRKKLEENNLKLVELDQVKNRFFANISHELRTPLTLLLAPLESLLHQAKDAFHADTRNLLATMHSNGMRLLKLINDLLDLVRLESGRMEVRRDPISVNEFMKTIVSAGHQLAHDKGVKLESVVQENLPPLLVDRDKLEKIVLNLMFNALKFTPTGGRVELKAGREGDHFILATADTGIGISEKNLPFVFDRFWQADGSSKRKYQGVGIGLSLVKELVEIQGGTVGVVSREGQGTTFTVQMPYLEPDATVPAPEATPSIIPEIPVAEGAKPIGREEWLANLYRRAELFSPVSSSPAAPAGPPVSAGEPPVPDAARNGRPSILIADDEAAMLGFLKSQLITHYHVVEASDGKEAFEKASQTLPDIILLDMNMPEKDGLQVCRELRQLDPTRNIPIILLTARADEETKLAALSAGASDFLTKPFSVSELHVRIRNLVQSHDYQEKLARQNEVLEVTIEQLKETETQLVQTEKMASLGRLSAGIIHEINNPLNFATTGLFTLRAKGKNLSPEEQSEFTEVLNDVEEGLSRVKNIVSDLRSFTHPGADHQDAVPVANVVASALKFLSNEWKDRVEIEVDLPAGLTVWANRNRLVQVFINMLQNSLEAIRHRPDDGEKPRVTIRSESTDSLTTVLIRDNGEGIDQKNLDKIFDPFFTTKDVGEGMGLGLSICYRIIRESGGQIRVKSERGRYSEFKLEFPKKNQQSPAVGNA